MASYTDYDKTESRGSSLSRAGTTLGPDAIIPSFEPGITRAQWLQLLIETLAANTTPRWTLLPNGDTAATASKPTPAAYEHGLINLGLQDNQPVEMITYGANHGHNNATADYIRHLLRQSSVFSYGPIGGVDLHRVKGQYSEHLHVATVLGMAYITDGLTAPAAPAAGAAPVNIDLGALSAAATQTVNVVPQMPAGLRQFVGLVDRTAVLARLNQLTMAGVTAAAADDQWVPARLLVLTPGGTNADHRGELADHIIAERGHFQAELAAYSLANPSVATVAATSSGSTSEKAWFMNAGATELVSTIDANNRLFFGQMRDPSVCSTIHDKTPVNLQKLPHKCQLAAQAVTTAFEKLGDLVTRMVKKFIKEHPNTMKAKVLRSVLSSADDVYYRRAIDSYVPGAWDKVFATLPRGHLLAWAVTYTFQANVYADKESLLSPLKSWRASVRAGLPNIESLSALITAAEARMRQITGNSLSRSEIGECVMIALNDSGPEWAATSHVNSAGPAVAGVTPKTMSQAYDAIRDKNDVGETVVDADYEALIAGLDRARTLISRARAQMADQDAHADQEEYARGSVSLLDGRTGGSDSLFGASPQGSTVQYCAGHIMLSGGCPRGSRCRFHHARSPDELRPSDIANLCGIINNYSTPPKLHPGTIEHFRLDASHFNDAVVRANPALLDKPNSLFGAASAGKNGGPKKPRPKRPQAATGPKPPTQAPTVAGSGQPTMPPTVNYVQAAAPGDATPRANINDLLSADTVNMIRSPNDDGTRRPVVGLSKDNVAIFDHHVKNKEPARGGSVSSEPTTAETPLSSDDSWGDPSESDDDSASSTDDDSTAGMAYDTSPPAGMTTSKDHYAVLAAWLSPDYPATLARRTEPWYTGEPPLSKISNTIRRVATMISSRQAGSPEEAGIRSSKSALSYAFSTCTVPRTVESSTDVSWYFGAISVLDSALRPSPTWHIPVERFAVCIDVLKQWEGRINIAEQCAADPDQRDAAHTEAFESLVAARLVQAGSGYLMPLHSWFMLFDGQTPASCATPWPMGDREDPAHVHLPLAGWHLGSVPRCHEWKRRKAFLEASSFTISRWFAVCLRMCFDDHARCEQNFVTKTVGSYGAPAASACFPTAKACQRWATGIESWDEEFDRFPTESSFLFGTSTLDSHRLRQLPGSPAWVADQLPVLQAKPPAPPPPSVGLQVPVGFMLHDGAASSRRQWAWKVTRSVVDIPPDATAVQLIAHVVRDPAVDPMDMVLFHGDVQVAYEKRVSDIVITPHKQLIVAFRTYAGDAVNALHGVRGLYSEGMDEYRGAQYLKFNHDSKRFEPFAVTPRIRDPLPRTTLNGEPGSFFDSGMIVPVVLRGKLAVAMGGDCINTSEAEHFWDLHRGRCFELDMHPRATVGELKHALVTSVRHASSVELAVENIRVSHRCGTASHTREHIMDNVTRTELSGHDALEDATHLSCLPWDDGSLFTAYYLPRLRASADADDGYGDDDDPPTHGDVVNIVVDPDSTDGSLDIVASAAAGPPNRFLYVLDSAATLNVSPDGDPDELMFTRTRNTSTNARVADGTVRDSILRGTTRLQFDDLTFSFDFERFAGGVDRIISIPCLCADGFTVHLTESTATSFIESPNGLRFGLVRTSASPTAMWGIVLEFDPDKPGHATMAYPPLATAIPAEKKTMWPDTASHSAASMGPVESSAFSAMLGGAFEEAGCAQESLCHLNAKTLPHSVLVVGNPKGARKVLFQRGRFPSLTGPALHAALGHISATKFKALRRRSVGLSKTATIPQENCRSCMLGASTRAAIPNRSPYSTASRFEKGERWGLDFGREFSESIFGHRSYVIFTEDKTLFSCLYFINSHDEIWAKIREHVAWVKATFGADIRCFSPDSDPMWTSARSIDPDTLEAKQISTEFSITFERSAPFSQATAIAENVQRPLLALTNKQLIHACLNNSFWEPSMRMAIDILNKLPKPSSSRDALANDVSPYEAMYGITPDISRLAGAFGSLCYVHVDQAKPSQLTDTSRQGLYFGAAKGSAGWNVFMLDTRSVLKSVHMTVDHELSRRPTAIIRSGELRGNVDDPPHDDVMEMFTITDGPGILVLDPVTHRPARVMEISDAYGSGDDHLTVVEAAVMAEGGGDTAASNDDTALQTPATNTNTTTDKRKNTASGTITRALPDDTPLVILQSNPKRSGTKSYERYEKYKQATTIGEFLNLGGTRGDLLNDSAPSRQYIKIAVDPAHVASMLSPAILHLARLPPGALTDVSDDGRSSPSYAFAAKTRKSDPKILHRPSHPATVGTSANSSHALPSVGVIDIDDGVSSIDDIAEQVALTVEARMSELGPPLDEVEDLDTIISSAITGSFYVTSPTPDELVKSTALDHPEAVLILADATTNPERVPDPSGPAALRSHPLKDKYVEQMKVELEQLLDKVKTLKIVPAKNAREAEQRGERIRYMPSMWVLLSKYHADGSFNRIKARLVACENNSQFDVPNTWSPTVSLSSFRLLLAIAARTKAHIMSLDVSGAYLMGQRDHDAPTVYARLPPNLDLVREIWDDPRIQYKNEDGQQMIFECSTNNWYGLQDAGRVWNATLKSWLLSEDMGFTQTTGDACVYIKRAGEDFIMLATYVDDMLGVFSSPEAKHWFLSAFEERFEQSPDSGDDHEEFLGITVGSAPDRSSHKLNTPKIFDKLEASVDGMHVPKAPRAPLPTNGFELVFAPESDENPIVPQSEVDTPSILGIAGWIVMAVRPAESFALSVLGRKVRTPTKSYVKALLHFIGYLLHTRDDELTIGSSTEEQHLTWVDSSWGNCPDTSRSWFGYCMNFPGSGAFAWRSKLSPCVALSSRDAEAVAAVFAVRAMLGTGILLHDLGFAPADPQLLLVDNMATVQNMQSDMIHRDSRHMAIRLAFLREQVRSDLISVQHVGGDMNLADVFTKILPGTVHADMRRVMMGLPPVD